VCHVVQVGFKWGTWWYIVPAWSNPIQVWCWFKTLVWRVSGS